MAACSRTQFQISAMPRPVSAEHAMARGVHPDGEPGRKCNAFLASATARSAARDVVAVGLVDGHQVGHFHHAALDALQFVAGAGQRDQQKEIHHVVDGGFRLADSDGLHKDVPVAGRFAQQHRFARVLRHAAKDAARWRRPDEGHVARRKRGHARLVAQDASAGALAAGIDREHRDLLPVLGNQIIAERFDQAALARAGNAGDSDPNGIAARSEDNASTICSASSRSAGRELSISVMAWASMARSPAQNAIDVLRARESLATPCSARQVRAAARSDAAGANLQRALACVGQSGCSSNAAAAQNAQDLLRGSRNHRARAVDAGHPGLVEKLVILRRNHAAHHHENVFAAQLAQFLDQLRHERLVSRGQRGNTDDVHIALDGEARHFARASGRADRCPHRSRCRRTRWRSPWRRDRDRPGPSWRPGCAVGGLLPVRIRRPSARAFLNSRHCRSRPNTRRRWCASPPRSVPRPFRAQTRFRPASRAARAASTAHSSRLPSPDAAHCFKRVQAPARRRSASRSRFNCSSRADLRRAHRSIVDVEHGNLRLFRRDGMHSRPR